MLQIMLKLITFSRSNYVKPPHVTGLFRLGCLAHGFGLRARTPSRGRPPLSKLWLASCVLIYADLVDFCDDFLLNSLSWANPRHVSGPYSRVFKTGMLVMPCWDRKSVEHCWALEEYGPEDWWFVTLWHPPLAMLWEWQRDEQHVESQCRFIYQCGKWYVMMRDKSLRCHLTISLGWVARLADQCFLSQRLEASNLVLIKVRVLSFRTLHCHFHGTRWLEMTMIFLPLRVHGSLVTLEGDNPRSESWIKLTEK